MAIVWHVTKPPRGPIPPRRRETLAYNAPISKQRDDMNNNASHSSVMSPPNRRLSVRDIQRAQQLKQMSGKERVYNMLDTSKDRLSTLIEKASRQMKPELESLK